MPGVNEQTEYKMMRVNLNKQIEWSVTGGSTDNTLFVYMKWDIVMIYIIRLL